MYSLFSRHPEVQPESEQMPAIMPEELEKQRVAGAVRTEIIPTAEIMTISYNQVVDSLW